MNILLFKIVRLWRLYHDMKSASDPSNLNLCKLAGIEKGNLFIIRKIDNSVTVQVLHDAVEALWKILPKCLWWPSSAMLKSLATTSQPDWHSRSSNRSLYFYFGLMYIKLYSQVSTLLSGWYFYLHFLFLHLVRLRNLTYSKQMYCVYW